MSLRSFLPLCLSIAPLLSGCSTSMSNQSTKNTTASEPARAPGTPAEEYQQKWDGHVATYQALPVGDYARLRALHSMQQLHMHMFNTHPELREELGPKWLAQMEPMLDVELAAWQAKADGWEGALPEKNADRPTGSLQIIHGLYVVLMSARRDPVESIYPQFVAMLTVDRVHDKSELVYKLDRNSISIFESTYGREATQEGCRQAVDAMPKNKEAEVQRLSIMLTCEWFHAESWREDLAMWTSKKELAAFEKKFGGEIDAVLAQRREEEANQEGWAREWADIEEGQREAAEYEAAKAAAEALERAKAYEEEED